MMRGLIPIAVVAATGLALLAEPMPVHSPLFDPSALTEAVLRNLGPLVILGWYLWYTTARLQPRRDREQREERAATAALSEARIDKIIEAHKSASAAFAESLKKQADTFSATAIRQSDVHEKMIENCYWHGFPKTGRRGECVGGDSTS